VFVLIKVLSEGEKSIIRIWSKMAHILIFSPKKYNILDEEQDFGIRSSIKIFYF